MSDQLDEMLKLSPYGTEPNVKRQHLVTQVGLALEGHYGRCELYRNWCAKKKFDPKDSASMSLAELPYLPVNIFKRLALHSTNDQNVLKILKSSATSSQTPSRVYLDKVTRDRQMKVLASCLKSVVGNARRPFIVLDAKPSSAQSGSVELSARVAGMRGYLMAASRVYYALKYENGTPKLDLEALDQAVAEIASNGEEFCLIGYTFVLYQYVIRELLARKVRFSFPASTKLIHFGGWKQLENQKVDKSQLNREAAHVFGVPVSNIVDIYGFTEQLGVIYPDDPEGVKRTPVFSEILVRDPVTFEAVPDGEVGLLEFITPVPHSYPGVVVLTDDMGRVVTRKASSNGWCGTGFEIIGRAKNAEVRGCGDTLPDSVYQVS